MIVYVAGFFDGTAPLGVYTDFELAVRHLCAFCFIEPRETLKWTVRFIDSDIRDTEAHLEWTALSASGKTIYIRAFSVETSPPTLDEALRRELCGRKEMHEA